jgi:hypothetical protein
MAKGAQIQDGDRMSGLIDGYDCVLKRMQRAKLRLPRIRPSILRRR